MSRLETKFVNDIAGKFIVPAYQRGYRWGTGEVRRLLEDVFALKGLSGQPNKNYCLQPIVVKKLSDGTFELIDGQQRLTTLFLLHWYAAKKENVPPEEFAFLKNFSYDTRPDSREFCEFLIDCDIAFDEKLSAAIENAVGFPLSWRKDPTVSSMLVMLDAIDEKFRGAENLWGKLKGGAISFYFLSIKDMGLTDELYITMNSRGKLLTDFEHFKAEFKRRLDELDRHLSDDIILKIDTDWTDLLWAYRDKGVNVDDGFLAYFAFLCDVILYRNGDTPQGRSRDAFTLLDEIFDGDASANIKFIKDSFNRWCTLAAREKISDFFADRVSKGSRVDGAVNQHAPGKIITYFDSADFRRRIRIVNNLVTNSGDAELSNSTKRNNGNRIPAMFEQVDNILLHGKILQRAEIQTANPYNFNEIQPEEERAKLSWTANNPDKAESLFELEDHYLLGGRIGIVGLEPPEHFGRFISLFKCDYDKIACALLTLGDYYQIDSNGSRYQLGSDKPQSWQNLFHKSALVKNFDATEDSLWQLLHGAKNFSDAYLQQIIDDYLADCENKSEFAWTYYFIKYDAFRPRRYGRYWWENFDGAPYCFVTLHEQKKRSTNSYQPFLKAVGVGKILGDYFGERLEIGEYYVTCENDSYVVWDADTDAPQHRVTIKQRDGVDTEDRIQKFKSWLNERSI